MESEGSEVNLHPVLHTIRLSLLMLAVGLPLVPVRAEPVRHPPEMDEMARVFRRRVRELSAQYEASIKTLPQQYQRDIRVLHDHFRNKGDLDGVLATDREIKRFAAAATEERDPFELTPEMPAEAIVAAPAELRQLQEQYVARFKDAAALRLNQIRDLAGKYLGGLQKVQSDLTRAGRIAEAVIIKQEAERLQQGSAAGTLLQLVEQMAVEQRPEPNDLAAPASVSNAPPGAAPTYGSVPNWARWIYAGNGRFARERTQYAHPDLPDELEVTFVERTGKGRFWGRCQVGSRQVGVALCNWFGKGLVWKVPDTGTLTASFVLTSRHLSPGEDHGPAVQLAVLANGVLLRAINVNLFERETTLRVVKDPRSERCALLWPRGGITETFELPANSAISLLLGVAVRNPGELCETTLVLQP